MPFCFIVVVSEKEYWGDKEQALANNSREKNNETYHVVLLLSMIFITSACIYHARILLFPFSALLKCSCSNWIELFSERPEKTRMK